MESARITREAMANGTLPKVTWEKIVEHIDHAVKVAGADHVGLGSDFDGATMPLGMEDASKLPKLTDALLKKGYSDADIEKILGGNLLRVMEQVERGAAGDEVTASPSVCGVQPGRRVSLDMSGQRWRITQINVDPLTTSTTASSAACDHRP